MRPAIGAATRVAGVVGQTGRRSLSPAIHNAWIEAAGIDAVYLPFSIQPGRFASLVEGLRGGSVRGLNVTIPFKEDALALADHVTPFARAAGAANLLVFEADGTVFADNTDGAGFLAALSGAGWRPPFGPVLVVGAGGAAKGAVAALLQAGAAQVTVANRTPARAAELVARSGAAVRSVAWADLPGQLDAAALVVNATSLGMEGHPGLDLPLDRMGEASVVMDMVYRPLQTPLLRNARSLGLTAVDGLSMLIGQAVPAFEHLFGQAAPTEVDVRRIALDQIAAET